MISLSSLILLRNQCLAPRTSGSILALVPDRESPSPSGPLPSGIQHLYYADTSGQTCFEGVITVACSELELPQGGAPGPTAALLVSPHLHNILTIAHTHPLPPPTCHSHKSQFTRAALVGEGGSSANDGSSAGFFMLHSHKFLRTAWAAC